MNIKKTILTIVIVGVSGFVIGLIAHSSLGLGEIFEPGTFLSRLIGTNAANFGMKLCLIGVIGTVFLVPNFRSEFTGSFSAGSEYKRGKSSKGRRGRI